MTRAPSTLSPPPLPGLTPPPMENKKTIDMGSLSTQQLEFSLKKKKEEEENKPEEKEELQTEIVSNSNTRNTSQNPTPPTGSTRNS